MPRSIMKRYAKQISEQKDEAANEETEESRWGSKEDERAGFVELVCPVCGKIFLPAPYHVYKNEKGEKVCTYKCVLNAPSSKKKAYRRIK